MISVFQNTVSVTSYVVCLARSEESKMYLKQLNGASDSQRQALFYDPFSIIVSDFVQSQPIFEQLKAQINQLSNINRFMQSIVIRTNYIDNAINEYISKHNIDQLVLLGCGMDGRSFRLDCLKQVNVYEIDKEEVLLARNEFLVSNSIPMKARSRSSISVDFMNDYDVSNWSTKLLGSGYRPDKPSIWILEGFLMYLPQEIVSSILVEIHRISCLHSYIIDLNVNQYIIDQAKSSQSEIEKTWKSHFPTDFQLELPKLGWKAIAVNSCGQIEPCDINWGVVHPPTPHCCIINKEGRQAIRNDCRIAILAIMEHNQM